MMRLILIAVGAFVSVLFASSSVFIVDQRQYAIIFALGEMKQVIEEPGLNFKLPSPLQNVVFLDKRILTNDPAESDRMITSDKKNIVVDSFVRWRIVDPKLYYVNFSGDEQRAQDRIHQIAKTALNDEIAKKTVTDVISGDRQKLMEPVRKRMIDETRNVGVETVDVQLKRVDFIDQITNSVYERMKSDRVRVANELRSKGAAESEQIRADADRQRVVILAEAFRDAEKIRGDGDAKASRIYSQAFGKNPEFYRFYRSLEAYRASFNNRNDVVVVDPSSEFFRYFKSSKAGAEKK